MEPHLFFLKVIYHVYLNLLFDIHIPLYCFKASFQAEALLTGFGHFLTSGILNNFLITGDLNIPA